MDLSCRKCGNPTHFDGVAIFGAKTICRHCGCKKPHTMRSHPIFPFFVILVGFLLLMLINPFDWSDDAMGFCFGAFFMLFSWFKIFWPMHLLAWKSKRSKFKDQVEFKTPLFMVCFSIAVFSCGLLSVLLFCSKTKIFSHDELSSTQIDYVFMLSGHEVTGGIDSVPLSPVGGNATKIGFINRAEFPVEVHWLDHNGTLHYLARLGQDHGQNAKAFVGQTWLVSDGDGTPLLYYVAEKETPDGAFGKGNFTRD